MCKNAESFVSWVVLPTAIRAGARESLRGGHTRSYGLPFVAMLPQQLRQSPTTWGNSRQLRGCSSRARSEGRNASCPVSVVWCVLLMTAVF